MTLNNNIKLIKITKEKENTLKNLMTLYLHDLCEFADDLKVNEEGKFEYDGIEYYFNQKELNPFLIYYKDEIAGFVLLNSGKFVQDGSDYSIHELFILKSYRSKGIATDSIKQVFEDYKGKYKVEQLENNKLAIDFWKRFYKKNNIVYEEKIEVIDGFNCYIQLFEV